MFTLLYPDTEKELFFSDYKPLPALHGLSLDNLYAMRENLENAIENAWLYGSELLEMALTMDLQKVNLYIRMKEKKEGKHNV